METLRRSELLLQHCNLSRYHFSWFDVGRHGTAKFCVCKIGSHFEQKTAKIVRHQAYNVFNRYNLEVTIFSQRMSLGLTVSIHFNYQSSFLGGSTYNSITKHKCLI